VNLPTHGMLTEEDIVFIASSIRKTCVRRPAVLASLS